MVKQIKTQRYILKNSSQDGRFYSQDVSIALPHVTFHMHSKSPIHKN